MRWSTRSRPPRSERPRLDLQAAAVAAEGSIVTVLTAPDRLTRREISVDVASVRRFVPGLLVAVAVAYAVLNFPHAVGGRDALALTETALVTLPAFFAVRPWRTVRTSVLIVAAAVATASLVVCLVTAPGWFGANRAASYGLAALLFVTVSAYARRIRRVEALAAVVVFAGGVQFFWAFLPWWGGRNPSVAMSGTFYWHNQFGAFMLAPAIIGCVFVVLGRSPTRSVGWIVTPFTIAGLIYSSSRGAMLVLVLGWAAVGLLALTMKGRVRRSVGRWVAISVLSIGISFMLAGPPLFSGFHLPWASTQARAATGETVEANGHYRTLMWREAVIVFDHHPVAGVGYGALTNVAQQLTPADWPRSPLAHNDYLQALAEGGILLALPFLVGCMAIATRLGRQFAKLARPHCADPFRAGVVIAGGALMAHAAIDFDWSYPALFALAAIVTGLAVGPATSTRTTRNKGGATVASTTTPWIRLAAVAVLVGAVCVGAVVGRGGGVRLVYHQTQTIASTAGGA
jgi:O-antigen ligase